MVIIDKKRVKTSHTHVSRVFVVVLFFGLVNWIRLIQTQAHTRYVEISGLARRNDARRQKNKHCDRNTKKRRQKNNIVLYSKRRERENREQSVCTLHLHMPFIQVTITQTESIDDKYILTICTVYM